MKETKFWKIGFTVLLIIALAAIGILAYYFGRGKNLLSQNKAVNPTVTATPTLSAQSEAQKIVEAVYAKKGFNKNDYTITVSKIEGDYAIGGIRPTTEGVGGAYFIAAKSNGVWVLVHDGQASPSCSQLTGYNFPVDMVPECLNAQDGVVKL